MDALPIDIHSNKLLDWLISRRHCQKEWIKNVPAVREKIKHAILDMPENERIVDLLKGGNINFFHCSEIVGILRETEKDTKNMFGYYSSQRMKDWQEIVDLYKKDRIYLAECAQILQRLVQYEIPSLKKSIQKGESGITESEKKERDYVKSAADAQNAYKKELQKFGIKGEHLKKELVGLAADLPTKFEKLAKEAFDFNAPIAYYDAFRDFVGLKSDQVFLALLRRLARKGQDVTVYEWKHEKVPKEVQRPEFGLKDEEEANDNEIDFGDDIDFDDGGQEIDFGDDLAIEVVADETGEKQAPTEEDDGIARYEQAFSIFEHAEAFGQLADDLEELLTFLQFRLADEEANDPAYVYIASLEKRPAELSSIGSTKLVEWKKQVEGYLAKLRDPLTRHLAKIRTSPSYVEDLISQLEQKGRLEHKYKQLEILANKKQKELSEQIVQWNDQYELLCDSARQLQGEIEDDISKLYNGREVNLIGEIQSVLYDN
ncbi:hypothetical protein M3Y97_01066800 [Aphelenchoides bicaudatus]|nr:hypothetical protein M3Y97_01066800 [Aphelenchoides bicaudatus]